MAEGMVDMELDDEASMDAVMPIPMPEKPRFPYGLRICLTHEELAKLGLDCDCEVGDELYFEACATVTSVSKNQGKDSEEVRVELQIEKMAVDTEPDDDEDDKG